MVQEFIRFSDISIDADDYKDFFLWKKSFSSLMKTKQFNNIFELLVSLSFNW
jgi:hypothetical protein